MDDFNVGIVRAGIVLFAKDMFGEFFSKLTATNL